MAETLSIRGIAESCLGETGDISVNTDVYGYRFRDSDGSVFGTLNGSDVLPGSGQARTRSLRRHLETISGTSVNLVIILVGHENDFSGAVSRDDVTKIQYALQVTRDLYAQVNLGVRRLLWQRISFADANSYINIADGGEAEDLTDDWNGPGSGLDVFFVQSIGDAGGWSNANGSCDKDSKDGRTGSVIELVSGRRFTGIITAHEVGHYLGLEHTNSATNLMGVDSNGDGIGEITNNSTQITSGQGATMRSHCSIRGGC